MYAFITFCCMLGMRSFEDLLHHIMMNETSHAGVPPASDIIIESLLREQVTSDTNQINRLGECCISMEPFEAGDTAISLPCGHSYKQDPIVQWLRMHNTCPGNFPRKYLIMMYPLTFLTYNPLYTMVMHTLRRSNSLLFHFSHVFSTQFLPKFISYYLSC